MLIILSMLAFVHPHLDCSSVGQNTFRQIPSRSHLEITLGLESEEWTSHSALYRFASQASQPQHAWFSSLEKKLHTPTLPVGGRMIQDGSWEGALLPAADHQTSGVTISQHDLEMCSVRRRLILPKRRNKWATFSFASHPLMSKVVNCCQQCKWDFHKDSYERFYSTCRRVGGPLC